MPQRKPLTWAQLRVGLLIIVALAILSVGIFLISGQQGFWERKYTLKTYFSSASGLREGADVRLAGIHVGVVKAVRVSASPEPSRAVEILMFVPRNFQKEIRADSVAKLATAGLLGEAFVDITRGKPTQPVVREGGEVRSVEEADIKRIVQNTNDVIANLRVLSEKLNAITGQIESGHGAIGKLIYDPSFYNRLNEATGTAERLLNTVEKGHGTLGRVLEDETLYERMLATIDHLNQVVDNVQHGKGSLAKFMNDPSIYDQVDQFTRKANVLIDNINRGQGSLGKLAKDTELYDRINSTAGHLDVIAKRVEDSQGTLGKLSTDDTLYTNLSTSSEALREFLTDFKKSPKKYLTLRVHIF